MIGLVLCVCCFVGFFIIVVTVCLFFCTVALNCSFPNPQVLPLFSVSLPYLTGSGGRVSEWNLFLAADWGCGLGLNYDNDSEVACVNHKSSDFAQSIPFYI